MKLIYLYILYPFVALYMWVAWIVFSWRNPTANEMSFVRDFPSVVTFQKLDKYQTP
jgi:hypothetical protein